MKVKEANEIVGAGSSALSKPAKMPGKSFGIPAKRCNVGSKLTKVAGTVCSKCYAMKGCYSWNCVKVAQERRYKRLKHPKWVTAMTTLVKRIPWFRWHDSGDIQGDWHMDNILEVCHSTPNTTHWLPTREYGVITKSVSKARLPDNLTVRLSTMKIDAPPPAVLAKRLGVVTSGVAKENSFDCPAPKQGGKCLDCRACWDRGIENVNYKLH